MIGPKDPGFYTVRLKDDQRKWEHLLAGNRYIVCRTFVDDVGSLHEVGESWTFLGYSYQGMDEGYSFFVSLDDKQEWHIPLQRQNQAAILDCFSNYVVDQIKLT